MIKLSSHLGIYFVVLLNSFKILKTFCPYECSSLEYFGSYSVLNGSFVRIQCFDDCCYLVSRYCFVRFCGLLRCCSGGYVLEYLVHFFLAWCCLSFAFLLREYFLPIPYMTMFDELCGVCQCPVLSFRPVNDCVTGVRVHFSENRPWGMFKFVELKIELVCFVRFFLSYFLSPVSKSFSIFA